MPSAARCARVPAAEQRLAPQLDPLALKRALAEHGSLRAAARALGVSAATVASEAKRLGLRAGQRAETPLTILCHHAGAASHIHLQRSLRLAPEPSRSYCSPPPSVQATHTPTGWAPGRCSWGSANCRVCSSAAWA